MIGSGVPGSDPRLHHGVRHRHWRQFAQHHSSWAITVDKSLAGELLGAARTKQLLSWMLSFHLGIGKCRRVSFFTSLWFAN